MTGEQAPSDWLLAKYDATTIPPEGIHRLLFQLLDDHPGGDCPPGSHGRCRHSSGDAQWPRPFLYADLYDEGEAA